MSCWREQPRVEENRGTEALPGEQSSEGCPGKRLFPRAGAARGTSRSSTEQRPSEQSCSTGQRQRQPEQQWDTGPGGRAAAAQGAGGREGAETWPLQPGKALSSCRIPSGTGAIGNAKCWLWERGGFTPRCHLLSHLPGIPGGRLSSAVPRDGSGHLTCTRAPLLALARGAAGAPVPVLQQPSWASCPFTPRDSQSLQTTLVSPAGGGSLAAPLGALEVWSKQRGAGQC